MPTKSRKRAKPRQITEYYIFEFQQVELDYSFSANKPLFGDGHYSEYSSLKFTALCRHPRQFIDQTVTGHITGSSDLLDPPNKPPDWKPKGVAHLELGKNRGDIYYTVPMHAFWGLQAAILAGHLRFILLYGPKLFRSRMIAISVQLTASFDPEEF